MDFEEINTEIKRLERKLRRTSDPIRKAEIECEIEYMYWELEGYIRWIGN